MRSVPASRGVSSKMSLSIGLPINVLLNLVSGSFRDVAVVLESRLSHLRWGFVLGKLAC